MECNPHPKAPHGFDRNASHSADRYVCECESWEPYSAGYQAGVRAAMEADHSWELLEALQAIATTKPQHGMNPNALVGDPMEVKVGWNVHWIAGAAIAKATGEAA